jgi:hypothetical protein
VVPRDRDVSNAQESGLNPLWFRNEATWRIAGSPRPAEQRLMTTWSDGENGGWFRQTHESAGFFGHFFAPYMDEVRAGSYPIVPVRLSDYLQEFPPTAYTQVQTGAWNVGSTSGEDLSQWAGSDAQRAAVKRISRLSDRYWALVKAHPAAQRGAALSEARRLILEAETSCFLFWGDSWIPHLEVRIRDAELLLDHAEGASQSQPGAVANEADGADVAS